MRELTIGRLRGGFAVSWHDNGRRRRYQLKARTGAEAESEAIEVYRRVTYLERPRGVTVGEIWSEYVDDLGDKPTARTMGYTGKAILPHFGACVPQDITNDLCRSYFAKRETQGISQGSVWTELGHLQSALNFAAKTRMIDRAPRVWRPEKPETDKRILSHNEAHALIESAREAHVRLAITLLLGTGARVGAILDLTWDRVDIERGVINLRLADSVTRKGRAVVPMNRTTRAALSVAKPAALTDYVIEYGGRRVKSIRKGFTAAVQRAEIGHVRIHDLRHTAAVTMLAAGIPIEKVAQVLGHSNTAVTYRTYGRYLPEHMQDAVDSLDFGSLNLRRSS